jgi:hypothetical protein
MRQRVMIFTTLGDILLGDALIESICGILARTPPLVAQLQQARATSLVALLGAAE